MPRRLPEPRPRSAKGLARHRWAASLGPAEQEAQEEVQLQVPAERPRAEVPEEEPREEVLGEWLREIGPRTETVFGEALQDEGKDHTPLALRWRTGPGAAALLAVLCVVLGGWFWWQAVESAPTVQPLREPPGAEPTGGSAPEEKGQPARAGGSGDQSQPKDPAGTAGPGLPGDAAGGAILVHVAGAVARPGVVQLPAGSRLHEAVTAAGGSTAAADLDRLNLAAVLEDGQKVLVPERGSPEPANQVPAGPAGPAAGPGSGAAMGPPAGGSGVPGSTGAPAGKINLNTAGVAELATLPRVGPVLAQRIVDWRTQHGRFGSVEELDAVEGVGPKLLEALLPLVRV